MKSNTVDFPTRGFLYTRDGKKSDHHAETLKERKASLVDSWSKRHDPEQRDAVRYLVEQAQYSKRMAKEDSQPMKDRAALESWGVVFGKIKDKWWQEVTLPEGWKIDRQGYHNYLRDELGRSRASFFAKYAFYDYDVFGSCDRRFSASAHPMHGVWIDGDAANVAVVTDGGKVIWRETITMADAVKRPYDEVTAIAHKQLVAMGLDKQSTNWDLVSPILPETAQSKKYRAKRIAYFEEQHEKAKEVLRRLRNTVVSTVYFDDGEHVMCPYEPFDRFMVDNTGRIRRPSKRREEMEDQQAKHEREIQAADEKACRIRNTIEALKRGERDE